MKDYVKKLREMKWMMMKDQEAQNLARELIWLEIPFSTRYVDGQVVIEITDED